MQLNIAQTVHKWHGMHGPYSIRKDTIFIEMDHQLLK